NEVLPQIATLIGVNLGARIIEVMVFDEGAKPRSPIVIGACNDLPCKVRVIFPSAGAKGAVRGGDINTRGFRIVNADARSDVRLESSKGESPDEVPHKRPSINEGSHTTASQYNSLGIP